jgi:hypothetical protein
MSICRRASEHRSIVSQTGSTFVGANLSTEVSLVRAVEAVGRLASPALIRECDSNRHGSPCAGHHSRVGRPRRKETLSAAESVPVSCQWTCPSCRGGYLETVTRIPPGSTIHASRSASSTPRIATTASGIVVRRESESALVRPILDVKTLDMFGRSRYRPF